MTLRTVQMEQKREMKRKSLVWKFVKRIKVFKVKRDNQNKRMKHLMVNVFKKKSNSNNKRCF